jgi:hypothetical protein
MQKLSEGWAVNRKIHDQLKQKLESMRRSNGGGRKSGGLRIAR